jgi:general L-amino acid transport system permease protein
MTQTNALKTQGHGLSLDMVPDRKRLRILRLRRNIVQGSVVAMAVVAVLFIAMALRSSFEARGVMFSFGFLGQPASFQISEGSLPTLSGGIDMVPFTSSMTNSQALLASFINTLKMAVVAIVLATILGAAIGVGRLSTNWIIRTGCFYIVEFLRNTPLLIQVTFWYTAVVLSMPSVTQATALPGSIYISRQGIWIPWFRIAEDAPGWTMAALLLGVIGLVAFLIRKAWRKPTWIVAALMVIVVALAVGGAAVDLPSVGKFNASGGLKLSAEYTALLIAITLSSAGHMGEIVRGTIEAMPKGQWEAASALGFSRRYTLRDIILPQVFRIVLPAFGNRYISLAKDTSLGIAIGYPDLFNVAGTVANQTGRMLETMALVMGIYLLMSVTISTLVNLLNKRLSRRDKR